MTRTLPWLRNGVKYAAQSSPRPSNTREPLSKRRRVATPPGSDDDLDLNTTGISTPSRRRLLRGTRTPSTSPPPAPPVQIPMREGWAEDDIWMMVEDEFYSTAQSYTQHLHHAEYKRLKEIAKNRENEIKTRPTDNGRSTMTADGKMASKVAAQEKKVKNALKKIGAEPNKEDEDMDEDDPWVGTQLAGLMDSPRKAAKLRASWLGAGRSETKAAKGFQRSSQTDITSQVTLSRKVGFDDEEPKAMSPTRARSNWRREREIQRQSTSFEDKTEDEDEQDDDLDDDDDLDASVRPRNVEKARLEPARAVATAFPPPQQIGEKRHAKSPREQLHATASSRSSAARADGPRRPSTRDVPRETAASRSSNIRAEKQKEPSSPPQSSLRKSRNHDGDGVVTSSKASPCSSRDTTHALVPTVTTSGEMAVPNQAMSIFARRRAEREKAKREKEAKDAKEQQGRRNSIEIPTFMV